MISKVWLRPNWGRGSLSQTPPPSVFIRFFMDDRSVLYDMGKIIKKFSGFYFSSYRENSSKIYDI